MIPEVRHLTGENPCLGKEVIVLGEDLFHAHEVAAQVVLARELIHAWEVVYSLVQLQLRKLIGQHALGVVPVYVPVGRLVVGQLVAQLFHGLFNHVVATFGSAKQKVLGLCFLLLF